MKELLSTAEAAARLGVHPKRVNALISAGRLPAQKVGGSLVIQAEDLELVRERRPGRPRKDTAMSETPGQYIARNMVDLMELGFCQWVYPGTAAGCSETARRIEIVDGEELHLCAKHAASVRRYVGRGTVAERVHLRPWKRPEGDLPEITVHYR